VGICLPKSVVKVSSPVLSQLLRRLAAHYQRNDCERAVIIETSLGRDIVVRIVNGEHLSAFFRNVRAALALDSVAGCVFRVQLPKSFDKCTIEIPAGEPATYEVKHSNYPDKPFGVAHLTQILGHHVDAKLSLTLWPQAPPLVAPVPTYYPGGCPSHLARSCFC
jgi:hypothetical protein